MFDLLETFEAAGLSRLVRDYFGEPPMLLARKGTLRRIATKARTGDGIRTARSWAPTSGPQHLAVAHALRCTANGLDVVGRRLDELVQTGDGAFAAWATIPDAVEAVAAGRWYDRSSSATSSSAPRSRPTVGRATLTPQVATKRRTAQKRAQEDRVRPVCPTCHLTVPANGRCDTCE